MPILRVAARLSPPRPIAVRSSTPGGTIESLLDDAYTYGHLGPIVFSVAMAIAFAAFASRVPAFRADFFYALSALLCAATGMAAMSLALHATVERGRLLFSAAVALYVSVPVLWHMQFAADVWPPAQRRRHRRLLAAYAAGGAVLIAAVELGLLDGGELRRLRVGGIESGLIAVPVWVAALVFSLACIIIPLSWRLLLADGPRRLERRSAVPLMLFAPPLCAQELLSSAGVFEVVPLGGYLAGLAAMQGIVVLAARFRALTEPRRLGPYRIERRLGAGGMAEVFLAHRKGEGPLATVVQPVALKRLRPEATRTADDAERLIEEARILARLSHPNIVKMLDAGLDDSGDVFLALELVEGSTLARVLDHASRAGRPLGRALAVEIGAQVASALGHAHPAGLVHRDVTPHNLLIDATGLVKLTDFGIARAADRSRTRTGLIRGKVLYVTPEQLRGAPYDERVDLYALGVVLHEAVVGRPPFEGDTDAEIVYRVLEGKRTDPGRLRDTAGDALAGLIERLLAPDADDRPASADAVLAELAPLRDEKAARDALAARVAEERADADASDRTARRETRRL
ncbi:MAG TPA: serine/threonine-protein kinase [Kofleriaceae bacterium]|nr:serine/threonine-protein kinase [Kofleriaceae bacterium]